MYENMAWADLETFGLNAKNDLIIEMSLIVTDSQLNMVDTFTSTIWTTEHDDRLAMMKSIILENDTSTPKRQKRLDGEVFVNGMHTGTGLFAQAQDERKMMEIVAIEAKLFLEKYGFGKTDPICGSSVGFDRAFLAEYMPEVNNLFSYRIIDVSSFKEMFKRKFPNRWKNLYESLDGVNEGLTTHRSLDDCFMSINEMKLYSKHFFPGADE